MFCHIIYNVRAMNPGLLAPYPIVFPLSLLPTRNIYEAYTSCPVKHNTHVIPFNTHNNLRRYLRVISNSIPTLRKPRQAQKG